MVKKEKSTPSLPPKRAHIDLTTKTLGSQKRKIDEVTDLHLENLGAEEALRKLVTFSQAVSISYSSNLCFSDFIFTDVVLVSSLRPHVSVHYHL